MPSMKGKLRVIGGIAKGRKLYSVPGNITRPITDRVKEALFNILAEDVTGSRFLDMFAGTGSVGIEALSRGANHVVFVDKHPLAIKTLINNLELTGLKKSASILKRDAFWFVKNCDEPFDIIFIAPPQYKGLWKKALALIDSKKEILTKSGLVIVQIDPVEYQEQKLLHLIKVDERKYGNTLLLFYRMKEEGEENEY